VGVLVIPAQVPPFRQHLCVIFKLARVHSASGGDGSAAATNLVSSVFHISRSRPQLVCIILPSFVNIHNHIHTLILSLLSEVHPTIRTITPPLLTSTPLLLHPVTHPPPVMSDRASRTFSVPNTLLAHARCPHRRWTPSSHTTDYWSEREKIH
jgi:hypothetical protein